MSDNKLTDKSEYNWLSVGPGGCDAHCVEHPCGRCALAAGIIQPDWKYMVDQDKAKK